ncbi:site-specific integrase [Dyella sp. C9]|uniref:tyrosine-type recombinase/integrase n=1 Tax=Dyella sp. C9 TaxID=2202154 RepID=UPI000DEF0EBD|nr:site-specific integrase [Dyella sp. C9]
MPKLKFNKTSIEALPFAQSAKGRTIYHDTEMPSLALRVGQTSKVYYFIKRNGHSGKVEYIKLGSSLELTPHNARDKARALAIGISTPARISEPAPVPSVAIYTGRQLVDDYLRLHASSKSDGGKGDRGHLQRDFLPRFADRDITSITRRELQEMLLSKQAPTPEEEQATLGQKRRRGGQVAANRLRAVVSKMFNFAIEHERTEVNPCGGIRAKKEVSRSRVLTSEEIRSIWRAFDRLPTQTIRSAHRMLLITAQRRSEVAGMEWQEIDLAKNLWTIPGSKTKNGVAQTVPLTEMALAELAKMRSINGDRTHVFWSDKNRGLHAGAQPGPIHPDWITNSIKVLRKTDSVLQQIEPFSPHDYRRTVATNVGELMESREAVKRLLNHVESGATKIYDRHTYDSLKRKALSLWESRLKEIIGR